MSLVRTKLSDIALTERGKRELEALAKKPDSYIDYSDIPPLSDDFFKKAKVGVFYRPMTNDDRLKPSMRLCASHRTENQ